MQIKVALKQHPLSAAFPSMPADDIKALADDILTHGQHEPGMILDDMVLDGWHRYLACQIAGLPFDAEQYPDDDPVKFVLSQNLHRRHLTASQRAAAIVACNGWRPNGVARGALVHGMKTKAEMAEEAGVSERTIVDAKNAHAAGFGEDVKNGKVSAKKAAAVAKLPAKDRAKALEAPAPKKAPAATSDVKALEAQVAALKQELAETRENLVDVAELAECAKAFTDNQEFIQMRALRAELRAVKHRRDDLMREVTECKAHAKLLQRKLDKLTK